MPRLSFTQKLSAAAGSMAALSVGAQDTEAAIVHVNNRPISLSQNAANGTEVDWDVDGNFGRDFFLVRATDFFDPIVHLNSNGANGRGFVNQGPVGDDGIRNLNSRFLVGPTLAAGYNFDVTGAGARRLIDDGAMGSDAFGFTSGQAGFAGFRFDAGGTTLYGWAELTIDVTAPATVTISQWAYEDTGAAIAVGATTAAVPEPSSLGLLALGAAGVTAWRRKKQSKPTTAV